jgi:hypothetical protein
MSFTIRIIEGLTAVPGSFKKPECWSDPSFPLKLKNKGINIEKIDDIFRMHYDDFLAVAGWIAHRDSMRKIRKEKPSEGGPEFRSYLTQEEIRVLDQIIGTTLSGLESAEVCLKERMIAICGSTKGLRTLTRKKVRWWLLFTKIMTDLYFYLFSFYLRKAYDIEKKAACEAFSSERDNTLSRLKAEDDFTTCSDKAYKEMWRGNKSDKQQSPEYAMFPTELCEDIAKLMKEYFPSLFQNYDSENVKNRIKERVEKASSKNPTKNFFTN